MACNSELPSHQMARRINWKSCCERRFFGGFCHVGLIFSPGLMASACGGVSSHPTLAWQDADLRRAQKKRSWKRKRQKDGHRAKSWLPRAGRLHNLRQERGCVCGGGREWAIGGERRAQLGEERRTFLRRHLALVRRGSVDKPASAACFDWVFSEEVDVVCFR